MAALNFFINGKKHITVLYFNHNTEHSQKVQTPLTNYCNALSIPINIGYITKPKDKKESQEEYWRNQRYNFFNQYTDAPIVTCHNLNDAVETWISSSLHGEGKLIPIQNNNTIRPFLLTTKQELLNWCINQYTPWWEDQSNQDTHHPRNYIRHILLPHALQINPGLFKVIKKKYLQS